MSRESACLRVSKNLGEKALTLTRRTGLIDKQLQIQRDKQDYLYIPLNREPSEKEKTNLKFQLLEFQLSTCSFSEKRRREKTLSEALEDELPPQLLEAVPRALDIVGDIAIINVPPELEKYKTSVGEAVLTVYKNVNVVLAKKGKVSGTFRLRSFEFIAGEHRTVTLHKEYGCSYYVDVAKAYFSPRLGHEHRRIASLVREGETIVDLFSGVGPFAVLMAKSCKTARVFAIDINVDAIELLNRNIRFNRVEGRVYSLLGDARKVVKEKLAGLADRVIMNLPETANEFVGAACQTIKPSGGIIHFYGFARRPQTLNDLKKEFRELVGNAGRKVDKFRYLGNVRETAPYEYQIVLDAKIS